MSEMLTTFTHSEKVSNRDMSLSYVCAQLPEIHEEFTTWYKQQLGKPEIVSGDSTRVQKLETLVTSMLVCVQETVKYTQEMEGRIRINENRMEDHGETKREEGEERENKEEDDEYDGDLENDHLVGGMIGDLKKQMKLLKIKKVCRVLV